MKDERGTDAVSPVIGVMLMLVVTIIIAALVSAFAAGVGTDRTTVPDTQIRYSGLDLTPNHAGLVFEHVGGSSIDLRDLQCRFLIGNTQLDFTYYDTFETYEKMKRRARWGYLVDPTIKLKNPDTGDNSDPSEYNSRFQILGKDPSVTIVEAGEKFKIYADFVLPNVNWAIQFRGLRYDPESGTYEGHGSASLEWNVENRFVLSDSQSGQILAQDVIIRPDTAYGGQ